MKSWYESPPILMVIAVGGMFALPNYLKYTFGTPGLYIGYAVSSLAALSLLISYVRERFRARIAGIERFYEEFEASENLEVFQEVHRRYQYLGISFSSVAVHFLSWYPRQGANCTVRLLLMDPAYTEGLAFQVLHKRGLLAVSAQSDEVRSEIDSLRKAIEATLAQFGHYCTPGSQFQIRLHRQKLRNWMHFVDEHALLCGFLRPAEDGLNCPVIRIERQKRWSLFDHYADEFDSLWDQSVPFHSPTAAPPGAAGATA